MGWVVVAVVALAAIAVGGYLLYDRYARTDQDARDNFSGSDASSATQDCDAAPAQTPEQRDFLRRLRERMQQSAQGRETLETLDRNHAEVIIYHGDDERSGSYYSNQDHRIYIDEQYGLTNGAESLTHEGTHYEYVATGRRADINGPDRDAYVAGMVNEEADATARGLRTERELRDSGNEFGQDYPGHDAYNEAYDGAYQDARANGAGMDAADEAGQAAGSTAVRNEVNRGSIYTVDPHSGERQSYRNYYQNDWDSNHRGGGSGS
jgi:hypothetical protein